MTVGERIVEARKSKGITQKALAEMTGIPLQTLVRYEKGANSNIPMGRIDTLAKALETDAFYLMGWEKPVLSTKHTENVLAVLKEHGASNEEMLAPFSTQELAEEIARRG